MFLYLFIYFILFFFQKKYLPNLPEIHYQEFCPDHQLDIFRDSFIIGHLLIFQKITRYFFSSNLPMYNVKIYGLCIFKVFVYLSKSLHTSFDHTKSSAHLVIPRKIFCSETWHISHCSFICHFYFSQFSLSQCNHTST